MKQKHQSGLQNGRTIGNYVLTRNLGQGTFGKVKLGIHSVTGEKVAVKVLQKSKIIDVSDVQRVTRQIHILKQIRHPHVIQLYEIIQTPKQLFLVMEYVSEGQLFELIVKKKRLKQSEACDFFRQLISGVQYLHQLGIVHRDLKPQNLLIDFNKSLKLVDFGLSNTYKSKQSLKTACGSPCYAAPQMISGKRYMGLNADLWSCGVILFAMICGYLPFQDPNTPALYKKIIAGDYSIPKFISASAKQLIQGLLTTDPQKRYKLKDIKNHAWYRQASDLQNNSKYGIKIGIHSIPIDIDLLQQMAEYNENLQQAKKYLQNNRHNHSITIYYLLLKKKLRNGINCQFDICSSSFNPQHLIKKQKLIEAKKEKSQSTNYNDIEEIQTDRITTPSFVGSFRSNRIVSRLSQAREKDSKKRDQSIQFNFQSNNLPLVDNLKATRQQKKRINQIMMNKQSNHEKKDEEISLYSVQPPFANKFHQTIATGWKKPTPTFRSSVNNSKMQQRQQKSEDKPKSQRYQSVQLRQQSQISQQKPINLMNKTFMGKIPKAYIPRWQNESQRIRSILNTTISGHGKRKHKLNFYY